MAATYDFTILILLLDSMILLWTFTIHTILGQLVSHRFLVDRSPASTGWMDVGVQSGDEECVEGLYVNTVEWT